MIDISVVGGKATQRKLDALENKVQKKIVRRAIRAGARPVLKQAKANLAPHKLTGALQKGLKIRAIKRSRFKIGVMVITPTRKALGIPADAPGYYPFSLEYGTKTQPAYPYMRPAEASKKEVAKRIIGKEIVAGIAAAVPGGKI